MRVILLVALFILRLSISQAQKDSLWTGELKEIAIRPYCPDSVWGSKEYNVADFIFIENNILLLVYEHELRWKSQSEGSRTLYSGARCILLDSLGSVRASSNPIGTEVECFEGEFLHGIFIRARYNRLKVEIINEEIQLTSMSDSDFLNYVRPYLGSIEEWTFVSTYDEYYPSFQYAFINSTTAQQKVLRTVEDKFCMELFRSEYKYLSPRQRMEVNQMAMDYNIDKKIIAAYSRGFHHSNYFEKPYAPAFYSEYGVVIFDHHSDSVYKFDRTGQVSNAFKIDYHNEQHPLKWKKRVFHDDISDRYYTLFSRGNKYFLCEIFIEGGGIGEAQSLFYPYPENINIHNGEVFYIYRPFESSQNRYLYKELIDKR